MSTRTIGSILVLVLGASLPLRVLAAGPASPQADESTRARELFNSLLQQGTNALAAGEYNAALDALLDARQIFDRKMRGKTAQVGSPEHLALLHGLALAYQLVDKPDKAAPLFANGTPLDRAASVKGAPRQLLVTRATMDVTQGYLAMRTATSLNKYLDEHPDELDSEILDLFFTALTRAQERVANRATLDAMIQNYEKYNARLEATRPFKKRWGVQWVDQVTFDINMHKLKSGRDNYQRALDRAADAGDEVQAAKAAVAAARLGRGSLPGANNRLARAQDILARRQEEAEEARAKIPPIPTLEKADLARLIQPHEAQVVVAKANDRTHAAAGQAESKPIQFTLGGGGPKTASGGGTTGGGGGTTYEPPAAAPASRRSFQKYAAGFAVAPDLFLTASSAVEGARTVRIEIPNALPLDATVERTGPEGLALLRVKGQKLSYLNLSTAFAGGAVTCPAFPEISVFGVSIESIRGHAAAPKDQGWKVALGKHPRLPGSPLLDTSGNLVGIELGDREDLYDRLPALSATKIQGFLGGDAPAQPSGNPGAAAVVQITAAFER